MSKGGLKLTNSAAIAMLLVAAVALSADAQNRRNRSSSSSSSSVTTSSADSGHAWKASELVGASVHTPDNEEKGKIKDLMISGSGRVEYAVVSFGGFLGLGDKLFAVPLDAIHIDWKDKKVNYVTVDVSEESIKERKGFDENKWPEHADRGFLTSSGNKGTKKTTTKSKSSAPAPTPAPVGPPAPAATN